jgi:alpha-amylase
MQTTIQPKLNNIYLVGEVLDGRIDYVSGYANIIGATLDYPLYFAIRNVFATKSADMYSLRTTLNAEARAFRDVGSLGVFVDNHDNVRFLNVNHDLSLYQNALTFGIFARGIPIVYYGSEQAYDGGADPLNRKPVCYHSTFLTSIVVEQFQHE